MTAQVHVIVPVRGDAAFLASALDSLRAQVDADWRATLLPIGDAALHAAQAQAGERIHVDTGNDADEAHGLARLLDACDSAHACILDGDDMLEAHALRSLLDALQADPAAGMAYSRHVLVDVAGRVLGPGPLCELPYSPDALLLDCMTGPLRLLRRDALRVAGGYPLDAGDAADYDLCLRLSELAPVAHVPLPLYRRRIHPQAPEVARWAEGIEARYAAFQRAVARRGLDAHYDCALEIDSWHVLQPRKPFGGWGQPR